MSSSHPITEHFVRIGSDPATAHGQFYLACGPVDGPLVMFVHGWPELSWSWRQQLPALAALGFRAVAPDMRGYGRSSMYNRHEDYAQERVVGDMIGLLAALGRKQAVWVGHDWGGPTVWSIASHYPEACLGVASLCVPYYTLERGLDALLELIDRKLYPEAEFPAGQWDYMRYYEESFPKAVESMQANVTNTVRLLFRRGDPTTVGTQSMTAFTRRNGGWFGPAGVAPELPRDEGVISEHDESIYVAALTRGGFFGPDSYYMNSKANGRFALSEVNNGRLTMPTLLLHARFDAVCETVTSPLARPMRVHCADVTEHIIDSGHWMAQEKPAEVNATLLAWIANKVPEAWPTS